MRRTSALRANGTSLEPIDRWRKPMPLPGPVNAVSGGVLRWLPCMAAPLFARLIAISATAAFDYIPPKHFA